jgi:hypothetical protein
MGLGPKIYLVVILLALVAASISYVVGREVSVGGDF